MSAEIRYIQVLLYFCFILNINLNVEGGGLVSVIGHVLTVFFNALFFILFPALIWMWRRGVWWL
jgi:hypothetical protein